MQSTTDPTAELIALRRRVAELESRQAAEHAFLGPLNTAAQFIRQHLRSLGIGMAVFSADLRRPLFVSDTAQQVLGMTDEQIQNSAEGWLPAVDPLDLPLLLAACERRQGEPSEVEFRLQRAGQRRWIRSQVSGRCGQNEEAYVVLSFEDITERKQTDEALRVSEGRYRRIVETACEGIVQVDKDWRICFVNRRMAEIMRMRPSEMLGRHVFQFATLEQRAQVDQIVARRESGVEETYRLWIQTRGGTRLLEITTAPQFDEQGLFAGSLGLVSDITDQQRAEEAARAVQQRFGAVAVHSPTGIFQCDVDARCLFINQRFATIAGIAADEGGNHSWLKTLHPEDREMVCSAWRMATAAETEFTQEFRFLHDDGTARWVWGSAVPLRDPSGALVSYLGNILDITERKQAEESLRASEQRFRLLSNCSPVGIFLTDQKGNLVYANPIYQSIAGRPAHELAGRGFLRALHPDERDTVIASWGRVATTTESHDVVRRYVHPNGDCRWVQVRSAPLVSQQGAVVGRVGTVEDITERRNVEDQLRESEERYRLLAEYSTDMISKHSPEGIYLYVSPACRALFGYEPEELIGKNPWSFVHPDDRAAALQSYMEMPTNPRVGPIAGRFRRKDGTYVWAESLAKTLPDDDPRYPGMIVAVTRDVTERKRAEDLLHESEKLAAAGRLAARVAHEINNPLAGIRNSFLLIEDAIPRHHPYYSYLSRIENEIDRIARIVRRMFDLYRPEPMPRHPIELPRTISDVAAMLDSIAGGRNVRLQVDAAQASGPVPLPEDAIRQVLYNIVVNAIEASPAGGIVKVRARRDDNCVEVSVTDMGQGIAPALGGQIYEPFFTTKEQTRTGGLGLGLPISHGIIESLQGTLAFECPPGGGTTFRFTIPLRPA